MKSVHENSTGYLIKIYSMVNENLVSQINRVFSRQGALVYRYSKSQK